jgi:hypothetical protein
LISLKKPARNMHFTKEYMDRPNTSMAAIVANGIAMTNRKQAIEYLLAHSVPERVIARVLNPSAGNRDRRALS